MEKLNETIINERIETSLTTHDFYYDLPEELIAQFPSAQRDMCRLMVLNRESGTVEHKVFRDIIDYLNPEDTTPKMLRQASQAPSTSQVSSIGST